MLNTIAAGIQLIIMNISTLLQDATCLRLSLMVIIYSSENLQSERDGSMDPESLERELPLNSEL